MNEELKDFFNIARKTIDKIERIHTTIDFGVGIPLYSKEIHTIQAIGKSPGITITSLAQNEGVTKGAVSQTIGKLVRKGLVRKVIYDINIKERHLELTEIGIIAFKTHERIDKEILTAFEDCFNNEVKPDIKLFTKMLSRVNQIIDANKSR
jgi:DNA-binding MarR family transcriptional regulator